MTRASGTDDEARPCARARVGRHPDLPAVRVGETYFADGGLRVNTPLSSVLRLGADRVLVLALRKGAAGGKEGDRQARNVESYGNPLFLFGKVLTRCCSTTSTTTSRTCAC